MARYIALKRSPELNPLDFCLQGYWKGLVYKKVPEDVDEFDTKLHYAIWSIKDSIMENTQKYLLRNMKVGIMIDSSHFEEPFMKKKIFPKDLLEGTLSRATKYFTSRNIFSPNSRNIEKKKEKSKKQKETIKNNKKSWFLIFSIITYQWIKIKYHNYVCDWNDLS